MRPLYLFPLNGKPVEIAVDRATGTIRLGSESPYFLPEDLIRQLREAADYIEKHSKKDRSVAKAR